MAYAVGAMPSDVTRITKLEMTWTVGKDPKRSYAFFSPWFGMRSMVKAASWQRHIWPPRAPLSASEGLGAAPSHS